MFLNEDDKYYCCKQIMKMFLGKQHKTLELIQDTLLLQTCQIFVIINIINIIIIDKIPAADAERKTGGKQCEEPTAGVKIGVDCLRLK